MTQSHLDPRWFLVALVPWLYLGAAALVHQGLHGQDGVTRAGSASAFAAAVEAAGGEASVRSGLWLDAVFIVTFAVVACVLLARTVPVLSPLPVVVAASDLTEGVVLAGLLTAAPSDQAAQRLQVLAVCKLVGYGLTIVALVVARVRSRARARR